MAHQLSLGGVSNFSLLHFSKWSIHPPTKTKIFFLKDDIVVLKCLFLTTLLHYSFTDPANKYCNARKCCAFSTRRNLKDFFPLTFFPAASELLRLLSTQLKITSRRFCVFLPHLYVFQALARKGQCFLFIGALQCPKNCPIQN